MAKTKAILVNLGTTEAPEEEAVRRFLLEFLSDAMVVDYPRWFWQPILRHMVLRSRPQKIARLYRTIWTEDGSPLEVGTREIAVAVNKLVGSRADVTYAYRYGKPSIRSCIEEAVSQKAEKISIVSLFPQRTGSTTGTIECYVADMIEAGQADSRVSVHHIPPDDRGYVAGMVEVWKNAIDGCGFVPDQLLLSFHGIPKRYDRNEGGRYRADCEATAASVLAELEWPVDRATLTYQSRFGPEPWIEPATDKVLEALPSRGVSRVAVATPGFLTEGLETLEEIGIRGRESFLGRGGTDFLLLPCVAANDLFVQSLSKLILSL